MVETATAGCGGPERDGIAKLIGGATCDRPQTVVVGNDRHHRSGAGAEGIVGTDSDDSGIGKVVAVRRVAARAASCGVQAADGIIAVAIAFPSPVDMELAAVVIAVEDKGMSA